LWRERQALRYPIGLRRVVAHHAQFDMDALAQRSVMALAGSEQLLRFLGACRFDPPLFDTPSMVAWNVRSFGCCCRLIRAAVLILRSDANQS
jgi:hypothetical protein